MDEGRQIESILNKIVLLYKVSFLAILYDSCLSCTLA